MNHAAMTPAEFKRKWHRYRGKESSAYQEHFSDLCRLLGQPTPAEADLTGPRILLLVNSALPTFPFVFRGLF